ncbi:hypothetical protein PENTCL1PPCAC_354, partial [Pristionchus entomophagus]
WMAAKREDARMASVGSSNDRLICFIHSLENRLEHLQLTTPSLGNADSSRSWAFMFHKCIMLSYDEDDVIVHGLRGWQR